MIDTTKLTIKKLREHIQNKDISVSEIVDAYLDTITKTDKDIHAYIEVFEDVKEEAKKIDERKMGGALAGVPMAVKDNILIQGKKASSGSKILQNYTATYDATAIKKLKNAGALFLGRTNMDEFAMGTSTETSFYGVTKNPLDTTRVPGGSSGGSAASVAGNMSLAAIGSDTGGSIRQPASFCGVVGLKPTYGAVSRHGLMALASSLDCIGPTAKTVEDAELVFQVIKGKDAMDSTTREQEIQERKKKPVIGFIDLSDLSSEITNVQHYEEARKELERLGYVTKDIQLPNIKYAVPTYYVLLPAEASSNLARYDGIKYGLSENGEELLDTYINTRGEGFGAEPRRRILLGTFVLSSGYYDAYYNTAQKVRRLIQEDFIQAFKGVDVIATPTTLGPAFKIGEKIDDPVQLYLEDLFTGPVNLTGLPALSVPFGHEEIEGKKLPLGLQFIAPALQEDILFQVGKTIYDDRQDLYQ